MLSKLEHSGDEVIPPPTFTLHQKYLSRTDRSRVSASTSNCFMLLDVDCVVVKVLLSLSPNALLVSISALAENSFLSSAFISTCTFTSASISIPPSKLLHSVSG